MNQLQRKQVQMNQLKRNNLKKISEKISAQICWVLNLVTSKHLVNSSSSSGDLFSVMFPDSDVVKQFQCGHTKAGYVAHFGSVPYFHELMLSKLPDCPYISLFFEKC